MAEAVQTGGPMIRALDDSWTLCVTAAGAFADPDAVFGAWLPAIVPGTAAQALAALGRWRLDAPTPLHDQDIWYRCRFAPADPTISRHTIRFDGLATIAEVWLNGDRILASDSMYLSHEVAVALEPSNTLVIAFRSLGAALAAAKGPRARWRPKMIPEQKLRLIRTTLLGHMPGWCPAVDAVGPFRPVTLIAESAGARIENADIRADLDGDTGRLTVELDIVWPNGSEPPAAADAALPPAVLSCAGRSMPMAWLEAADGRPRLRAELALPGVAPWWPHSHGAPNQHAASVRIGDARFELGRVGFRRIEIDRGADGQGFGLVVNGVPVFCRGVCWTPADLVSLAGDRATYARELGRAVEGNLNMIRVSGAMLYEAKPFHDLCDELGILVWQEFMFANFDYPIADMDFADKVRLEAEQLLRRLQASPSLAVLCGGSEVAQQAAMLGLPAEAWSSPLYQTVLPEAIARLRPDVAYVPSSPWGGALPFAADAGVTHYYGVGAYRRPLDDARRARVRFASECLAFANVPEAATLAEALDVPAVHHPLWKARSPRDLGASWDFEDVRDHYLGLVYGVDPARLRTEDPARYLDLARAAPAEVIEATLAEWRRPGSPTAGALIWFAKDFVAGAGWGLIDALGRPKSVWHALQRAGRPVQVLLADEGVNGLAVHVINDGAEPVAAELTLQSLRDGRVAVARGGRRLELAPHSQQSLAATELYGGFFDATYAYRFGPPAHELSVARLATPAGDTIAEAFHWLDGERGRRHRLGLAAALRRDGDGWSLALTAERAAASVHIDDAGHDAADNWFHLAPGVEKTVRLVARPGATAPPEGEVRAVNGADAVRYRWSAPAG